MEKAVRNSNHELLRIIAMNMIVLIHFNMYSANFYTGSELAFFNGIVNGICNIGVTCFILISGYYGIKFDIRKLIKMECMMISYSFIETAILYVVFPGQLQGAALLEQLVKSCFPLVTRKYWFYSCYVCLFLFSKYIQKLIDILEKAEFKKLLILLFMLFSVFPTLFYFEIIPDNGKGLTQMIMVYLLGRYIAIYCDKPLRELCGAKKVLALFVVLWVVNGVSHEVPIQIGGIYHHLCKDNSITNIVMAFLLFFLFKDVKIRSGFINHVASYIFAVFALNNSLAGVVMKVIVEQGFVSPGGMTGFLMLLGCSFGIFLLCILIGVVRDAAFGRLDKRIGDIIEELVKGKKIRNF